MGPSTQIDSSPLYKGILSSRPILTMDLIYYIWLFNQKSNRMNRQAMLIEVLKSEGLRIVDEEGFPFESEVENDEAWQIAIDGEAHEWENFIGDNEDAWEHQLYLDEERRRLKALRDKLWYERRCIKPLDNEAMWRGEIGKGLINNIHPGPDRVRNSKGEIIDYESWVERVQGSEDFQW